jgi:ketosteroid isomerase-like protein
MKKSFAAVLLALVPLLSLVGCTYQDPTQAIIGKEREALDRWGNGDPFGYINLSDTSMTYFDPSLEKRIDGRKAFEEYIAPVKGKISIDRYEMINPKVQTHGEVAVLTYNLIDYAKGDTSRWNSTEVYRLVQGDWKLIHSHWSFTRPPLKP